MPNIISPFPYLVDLTKTNKQSVPEIRLFRCRSDAEKHFVFVNFVSVICNCEKHATRTMDFSFFSPKRVVQVGRVERWKPHILIYVVHFLFQCRRVKVK